MTCGGPRFAGDIRRGSWRRRNIDWSPEPLAKLPVRAGDAGDGVDRAADAHHDGTLELRGRTYRGSIPWWAAHRDEQASARRARHRVGILGQPRDRRNNRRASLPPAVGVCLSESLDGTLEDLGTSAEKVDPKPRRAACPISSSMRSIPAHARAADPRGNLEADPRFAIGVTRPYARRSGTASGRLASRRASRHRSPCAACIDLPRWHVRSLRRRPPCPDDQSAAETSARSVMPGRG